MMEKNVPSVPSQKLVGGVSPRSGRKNVAHGVSRGSANAPSPPSPLPLERERGAEGGVRAIEPRADALGYILSPLTGLREGYPHKAVFRKELLARDAGPFCGRGSIFVISAPSGAGKSTLVRRLIASLPDLAFSVSHTTRPRRAGEKEGRDYFFVTRRRFESMIAAGDFVEWAEVFGHLYGTSKAQLDKALATGRDVLLDIDVQGHQQVKQRLPEALSVFVLPPSFRELKRRLTDRDSDSPQVVERRLAAARQEISHWPEYDYLVVNDRLALATQALQAIVRASRFRQQSQAERAQEICRTFGG